MCWGTRFAIAIGMTDEKKDSASTTSVPRSDAKPGDGLSSIWQSALGQIDEIRDVANVATSFPGFLEIARTAGLHIEMP